MAKHTKLTSTERCLLAQWKNQGLSNIECGKRLGRDKSTISRELKRNKTKVKVGKYAEVIYEPHHAQFVAMERKQKAFAAKQPLKSKKIYGYVMEHLKGGWSPEGIAGRLRKENHPDDPTLNYGMTLICRHSMLIRTHPGREGLMNTVTVC